MVSQFKILIGSPIRQSPAILKEFLQSLENLDKNNYQIDYYFIDDNDKKESVQVLNEFRDKIINRNEQITINCDAHNDIYICNQTTHQWTNQLIQKVANYKNKIIQYCIAQGYDYLFLVDSDLVLHPKTLNQLISSDKNIVSEIFWTQWQPESDPLPQIWHYDQYSFTKNPNSGLQEDKIKSQEVLEMLKIPGIYKVGGLGACTLISRKALTQGVNFEELYNISFWGEDRHFSIKAVALGFELFVDTHYPAYHIYRENDLAGVDNYKKGMGQIHKANSNSVAAKIKERANDFIKVFLSCDYRITTGFEGFKYLSPTYITKTTKIQNHLLNFLNSNHIKCTAHPGLTEIDQITQHSVCVAVNFMLKSNYSKEENFFCKIEFKKYPNDLWLIEQLSFFDHDNNSLLGYTLADILGSKKRIDKSLNNHLTLSMIVRNEGNKYLERVLEHAAKYIDNAVILDDASSDNTVDLCKQVLGKIPLQITSNSVSKFHNEVSLRKQLWDLTTQTSPDWILCLDADEVFENSIIDFVKDLMNQPSFDYYDFRLYDLWDETHYREDNYWHAHQYFRTFLIRYQPNFNYTWQETPQHCGRFPNNLNLLRGCQCGIRLKHYGWANELLREEKYQRYMMLDPEGIYGSMNQYRTILDLHPVLKLWE